MLDHWNKPLSRPLSLRGGRTLDTLHEAATCLISSGMSVLRDTGSCGCERLPD
jgi:hypothetical protein